MNQVENFKTLKTLALLASLVTIPLSPLMQSSFAQDDDYFESEQFDIDGSYEKPKKDFSKKRKSVEGNTNDLVDKKIEDIRLKHEKNLQSDLKTIFTGEDKVTQKHAAPEKVVATAPAPKTYNDFQFTPVLGFSSIQNDNINITSQIVT